MQALRHCQLTVLVVLIELKVNLSFCFMDVKGDYERYWGKNWLGLSC